MPTLAIKTTRDRLKELDYIGPVLYIPGIVSFLLALQWGGTEYPWNSTRIIGLFVASVALISSWIYSQFRLGDKATIPMRILTQRTVFWASVFAFQVGAISMIDLYYIPVYFQGIRATNATHAAVDLIPLVISAVISSVVAGALVTKLGYYVPFMIGGAGLISISSGLLSTLEVTTSAGRWIGFQIMAGTGLGLCTQVFSSAVLNSKNRCQCLPFNQLFSLWTRLLRVWCIWSSNN